MDHPREETLLRYRFDTLEPGESKQVADHLRTCSECATRFAAIGKSVEKLSAFTGRITVVPVAATSNSRTRIRRCCRIWTPSSIL